MAIEIGEGGMPLKLTAELDSKKLETELKRLLKTFNQEFQSASTSLTTSIGKNVGKSARNVIDKEFLKNIATANVAFEELSAKAKDLYSRLGEIRVQSQNLMGAKKALHQQMKAGEITSDEYLRSLTAIESQQGQLRAATNQLNAEIRQNINLEKAATGSLEEARIKYNQLTAAITKAGGAMDGSNPAIKTMIADHQALRKEIDNMEHQMGMYQRNVGNYASGWNGMQNSINQVMRELPAFTYSAQTGFIAISNNLPIVVDELKRAADANKALTAEGKKGVPVWKQLVGSLLSWQSAMMIGITLMTVYGKEIGNFFASLFKGTEAVNQSIDRLKLLNDVRKDAAKNAAAEMASLKALTSVARDHTRSMDERRRAAVQVQEIAKSYNKSISTEKLLIGNLTAEYKSLSIAIIEAAKSKAAQSKIEENAAKRLEVEFEVERLKEANEERKEAIRLDGDRRNVMRRGGAMSDLPMDIVVETVEERQAASDRYTENEIANANKRIEVIQKEDEFLQKFIRVPEQVKNDNTVKTVESLYSKLTNSSKELLQDIADLDREYARKAMQSDAAEMQALRDKFEKFRKLIEEENEKIRKYNEKNSKIKGFQPVPLLDGSQIDPIESRAAQDLSYTQATARLEKEIQKQKEVFADYEEYRSKLGKEKADERYRDQLAGFETYLQYLQSIQSKEQQAFDAVNSGTGTAGQQNRVQILVDEINDAKRAEEKAMSDVLASMVTYEQKRKNLIEQYNAERKTILESASKEELAIFDTMHQESLSALDDAQIQQLEAYQHLFDGIQDLSDAAARRVIANAKEMLSVNKTVSEAERTKVEKAIQEAEQALDDRLPARVADVARSFSEMANSIGEANEELASMLQGLSNILTAVVQVDKGIDGLKSGLANWKSHKESGEGGVLGTISAIAGVAGPVGQIVSAVSSVVSGVVKFFKASRESARQAAEQIKQYQESVLAGELEYNRVLRERSREQQNINDLTTKEIQLRQRLLLQQESNAERDYQAMLMRIQREGQQITGQRTEKYGGFLGIGRKTRVVDITSGLAGYTYDELERLYTSNKLTEATKKQFEQLQKLKNEVDDIAKLWDDAQAELVSRMSGGITSNAITNSIIDGFKNGKRAVHDFADDMEEIIQNALLSAMAYTYLDEPLKKLVDDFQKASLDGLTQSEITAFEDGYMKIIQAGVKGLETIESVLGKRIGSGLDAQTPANRVGRSITEDTAQQAIGIWYSQREYLKQISTQNHKELLNIANSKLIAMNAIERNTAQTVGRLDDVIIELQAIKGNTKGVRNGG